MREYTNLCVEIMNSRRQGKEKLGHAVQIRVCRLSYTSLKERKNGMNMYRKALWRMVK